MNLPITYVLYLGISFASTVWVARTLHRRGRIFLVTNFHGNEVLVDSLGHLLSVGFYLMHVGFLLLALKLGGHAMALVDAVELLSTKIGVVLVVLAVSHFGHIALSARMHGKPVPLNRGANVFTVAAELVDRSREDDASCDVFASCS